MMKEGQSRRWWLGALFASGTALGLLLTHTVASGGGLGGPGLTPSASVTASSGAFSGAITSTVASGSDAVLLTRGARLHFGSGTDPYIVGEAARLVTLQGFYVGDTLDAAGSNLYVTTSATNISNKLVTAVQAITVADDGAGTAAASTLTPSKAYVEYTCSDANGCNITVSESGAADGTTVRIVNVSANTVNFSDTSGVTELSGAVALGQWDNLTLLYAVDRWVQVGPTGNN